MEEKGLMFSRYISTRNVTHSDTAIRMGIANTPTKRQLVVLKHLATHFFDDLVVRFGVVPSITSFYRNRTLNTAIKGARNSDHIVLGDVAAIDIKHGNNVALFLFILENMDFYKLIAEFPINGKPSWIHVSFSTDPNKNRLKKAMVARKKRVLENGVWVNRTVYTNYDKNKNEIYG